MHRTGSRFLHYNVKLKNVNRFKYLGSYVTNDCGMIDEVTSRIQALSCAFGRLRQRVFHSHDLTTSTKLKVYNQCLTPLLMYGSETWTPYQHQVRKLRTIQQRHLRSIMKIKWDHYVSNEEVLSKANIKDIETVLVNSRLRWLGHVARMNCERPCKALLYGELANGTCRTGRPKLRYKDSCKSALKCGGVIKEWRGKVNESSEWRQLVKTTCEKVNEKRIAEYERRRERRRWVQSKSK